MVSTSGVVNMIEYYNNPNEASSKLKVDRHGNRWVKNKYGSHTCVFAVTDNVYEGMKLAIDSRKLKLYNPVEASSFH